MEFLRKVWLFIIGLTLIACNKSDRQQEIDAILEHWIGKQIQFPDHLQCNVMGADTLEMLCMSAFNTEYRILVYIDTLGCTSCKLNLLQWEQFIDNASEEFGDKLSYLFYIHPRNLEDINFMLKRDGIPFPVIIDTLNHINKLNNFPEKQSYQCFLLNRNNEVISVGNPTLNSRIWELYKKQISANKESEVLNNTFVEIDKTSYDFEIININTKNEVKFKIKNIGNEPFIINHITTSCGCINAKWNKEPTLPNEYTEITIEVTATGEGYFNKTIHVYCNVKQSFFELSVRGMGVQNGIINH
jgi:hypothetical protein